MQLEISGKRFIDDPKDVDIAEGIASLSGGVDSFAILSASDQFYVQCAGSEESDFDLEYRDGAESRHFRAAREIDIERVIEAMQRYNRGDLEWNDGIEFVLLGSSGDKAPPVPEEKGEKLFEMSNGTLVIGWSWVVTFLSILSMLAGAGLFFLLPSSLWELPALFFGGGLAILLLPKRSSAEKRGY